MDLKRAWRNGFLVSVIFAIPLSDLYNNQLSNLLVGNSAREARVVRNCETDEPCNNLKDVRNADDKDTIFDVPSSWDSNFEEENPTIPATVLADLLTEPDHTDFGDIRQAMVQFDPQDIFLSESIREFDRGVSGNSRQSDIANFGSHYAPGFSGPFTPAIFPGAGKSSNTGLDPIRDSLLQIEAGDSVDSSSETTPVGAGDESLHNVPEPSPFVLITIGTLSVATLLYRKSKASTPHS